MKQFDYEWDGRQYHIFDNRLGREFPLATTRTRENAERIVGALNAAH